MDHEPPAFDAVTVTLNPAIDRTLAIPRFEAGAVNRVEQVRDQPGGKGVNVAVRLAEAGVRTAATGFLGRDNAAPFEALFARRRIADHFVRLAGETRVGIKVVDPERRQTTDINFPGLAPGPDDLAALRARLDTLAARPGTCFVLAGSLPPGVDASIYGELVRALRARGAAVVLDTSGAALGPGLDAAPHVVKPNIHEFEALLGAALPDTAAVVAAARHLVAVRGPELVVVSMGRAGACFVSAEAAVTAVPPEVTVRSTVGAGDAMVAGIVAARLRRLPLDECARLATAFSVDALTRPAEDAPLPGAIEALMSHVTLVP